MPAMLQWPELSRKPAIKTRTTTTDPTLRDPMQNGAEATALQFGRGRRQWDVSIDALPDADVQALETFVREKARYGTQPFAFPDERVKASPRTLIVKFSTIPAYTDVAAESEDGEGIQQNCTFTLKEV